MITNESKRGSTNYLTSGISKSHGRIVAVDWLQQLLSDARI